MAGCSLFPALKLPLFETDWATAEAAATAPDICFTSFNGGGGGAVTGGGGGAVTGGGGGAVTGGGSGGDVGNAGGKTEGGNGAILVWGGGGGAGTGGKLKFSESSSTDGGGGVDLLQRMDSAAAEDLAILY
jgi:hypothetical protein